MGEILHAAYLFKVHTPTEFEPSGKGHCFCPSVCLQFSHPISNLDINRSSKVKMLGHLILQLVTYDHLLAISLYSVVLN